MPEKTSYWDADVFLAYLEKDSPHGPLLELLLDDARADKLGVITSVVTQVEVAFISTEKEGKALSAEDEAAINQLWLPSSPITVVEFSPLIAMKARDLIRTGLPMGWNLKAHDAVHLASAMQYGVDEFYTYETRLRRYADITGFPVLQPEESNLRIA
jgi:predicted nucleic acid-binding protein